MRNISKYIQEVKTRLIESPIRKQLENSVSIPFKDLVSRNLNEIIANIEVLEKKENEPLKLVVVGEVKSGKSSFVNALLSREVSEVDILEATSSIIEVGYDKDGYTKSIDGVTKICLDIEYLKRVNIVDTPGLRSITAKNEKKTLGYIQNADLIVFLFDATHLGQEDILDILDLISSYKKPLIGIINKADLLEDNKEDIMDYISDEYGIYIEDFFMISSYLEYQDRVSKNATIGNTDIVISRDKDLKENFLRLNEYIDKVYKNSEMIKSESIMSSLEGIMHKDLINHNDYYKSISILIEEIKKHEKLLENKLDYINSKMDFEINDWISRIFLNDEINRVKDNIENANMYINEIYINDIINKKKSGLDSLFFGEWLECLKEVTDEIDEDIKRYIEHVDYKRELVNTPDFKIDNDEINLNEMLATVGTGAILGATSGGIISIYAASIGLSSTSLTIGSALMTYCPPLLIAGTISGALGKVIYDKMKSDSKSKEIINDIENFTVQIKLDILQELKDIYSKSSKEIVDASKSIYKNLKGIQINSYELEKLLNELEVYIEDMKRYIKI